MSEILQLEVARFDSRTKWRWELKDDKGNHLCDHEVNLDPSHPNVPALLNLLQYVYDNSAPDTWIRDEQRIIDEMGTWLGDNVFGPIGTRIIQDAPVTVLVKVPPEASVIQQLPLEIARINEIPLALQDVSLVFEVTGKEVRKRPVGPTLRMLAIFSLPTDASALSLRRERYELMRQIHNISKGKLAIDMRVLQYGVTRDVLRDVLEEAEGWDIIHFSGHGRENILVLEKEDGTQDTIPSDDLVKLLNPARNQIKLVTLSACLSAAATIEETLRWLGLWNADNQAQARSCDIDSQDSVASLASILVQKMDCAVLAMRYPVADGFAISFCENLYDRLLGKNQPLPRALQLALPAALSGDSDASVPPISVATPALFGNYATNLSLKPPKGKIPVDVGLAGFLPEPEHFVGRTSEMANASSALAHESGKSGVLFHGMAGGGKTACALETVYHQHRSGRFDTYVWYRAPESGKAIEGSLREFAVAMETKIPDFAMIQAVGSEDELKKWLPVLTERMEQDNILVVMDNIESLLDKEGHWRDRMWGLVISAMIDHDGLSRIILTSRTKTADLDLDKIQVDTINALSLKEAALLAREYQHLGQLMAKRQTAELVTRTLELVQGHPKLIELAEGQAVDPKKLEQQLDLASKTWQVDESRLRSFFQSGQTTVEAEEFLEALKGWTQGISASMPPASRTLFQFLSSLEEDDRTSFVVESNWADLWKRLGLGEEPPTIQDALTPLVNAGLVKIQPAGDLTIYSIHPGVAEAGRADKDFQAAVDNELALFWYTGFKKGLESDEEGGGGLVVYAGLRAAPYLMRLGEWGAAADLLEKVMYRDNSPATANLVLPLLQAIGCKTEGDETLILQGRMAKALRNAGRLEEAEKAFRESMAQAEKIRDFRSASTLATDIINILRVHGRYPEALELVDKMKEFTRQAGLGRWNQIGDEGQRLQILNEMGHYQEVLDAIGPLWEEMQSLPKKDEDNVVETWNVKEGVLDTGHTAALRLEDWELCLQINQVIVDITKSRNAPTLEVARFMFNDFRPLIELKRDDEAENLLRYCRAVYEQENYFEGLARLFGAWAILEDSRSHLNQAVKFGEKYLRYSYVSGSIQDISFSHFNMANYLRKAGSEKALSHRIAAGIINYLSSGELESTLRAIGRDIAIFGREKVPASFGDLCKVAGEVEGVEFKKLFHQLAGLNASGDQVMQKVLEMLAGQDLESTSSSPDETEPESEEGLTLEQLLSMVEEAARGNVELRDQLLPAMDQMAQASEFPPELRSLSEVLGSILKGDLDPSLDVLTPELATLIREMVVRIKQAQS